MAEPRVRSPSSDYKLKWEKRRGRVPITIPDFAVSIEERVYIADLKSADVYEYHITTGQWLKLPPCGVQGFSLANVRGSLTTIGGQYHLGSGGHVEIATDCFSWDGASRRWVKLYPPIPTANLWPAVVTTADQVVVAGTLIDSSSVHVMDISTRQWSTVVSLPVPSDVESIAVCNGTVYVAVSDYYSSQIYYCSLNVLLSSTPDQREVWHKTDSPQCSNFFSLVTVNHILLLLGPQHDDRLHVFLYEEAEEAFTELEASTNLVCYVLCATALSGERVFVMDNATVVIGKLPSISPGNEGSVSFLILVQASLNSLPII